AASGCEARERNESSAVARLRNLSGESQRRFGGYGTTEVVLSALVLLPFVLFLLVPWLRVLIPIPSREDARQNNFGKLVLVRVADHAGHAGQGRDFLGGTLSVASGHDNLGVGILAPDTADGGAGILVGRGRYGTGIEDDHVRVAGRGVGQSALFELALQGSAIRLGCTAAEIFYMEGGHWSMVAHFSCAPQRAFCRIKTFRLRSKREKHGTANNLFFS